MSLFMNCCFGNHHFIFYLSLACMVRQLQHNLACMLTRSVVFTCIFIEIIPTCISEYYIEIMFLQSHMSLNPLNLLNFCIIWLVQGGLLNSHTLVPIR